MPDMTRMPRHVAVIMDGNGRWAKKRNLPRILGHNAGMNALVEAVRHSSDMGIKHFTAYAFSTENWKRSGEEVSGIFKLLVKFVDSKLAELHRENVRVRILGDHSVLPGIAVERLDKMVELTEGNTGLQFNICLNYGSRDEIRRAAVKIAEDVRDGKLRPEDITEETLAGHLYTGVEEIPDPDLLIRTSGEERLSNYLLWQLAYSEMIFTDVLWPDFTPEVYDGLIEQYQKRERRFGGR
ncbi:MAG: isoprenyl transferase [Eubacteriaceae bacterium]|nr:isoprenyl transferase [Eubacteriaceae bacterium]